MNNLIMFNTILINNNVLNITIVHILVSYKALCYFLADILVLCLYYDKLYYITIKSIIIISNI